MKPKYLYIKVLQGKYDNCWEDLTWCRAKESLQQDYKDYRDNAGIPLRIIKRRVPNDGTFRGI